MSLINQFRQQIRTYIYIPVYKGPFEYKKKETKMNRFPFGINQTTLERELEEIKLIREKPVQDVSPFHLVWRYKPFFGNIWYVVKLVKLLKLMFFMSY